VVSSAPVSTPAPRDFTNDALVNTCREIRKALAKQPPHSLRVIAPQVVEVLPKVQALCLGIEDLADRVRLLEIAEANR
jgi:hypothetical protein